MNPSARVQGLITFANKPLYDRAQIPFPPPPELQRPGECCHSSYGECAQQGGIRDYDTVFVNSQVPPHEQTNEKVDLAITYMTEAQKIQVLCFIEGKRTSERQSYNTKTVETKLWNIAKRFSPTINRTPLCTLAHLLVCTYGYGSSTKSPRILHRCGAPHFEEATKITRI